MWKERDKERKHNKNAIETHEKAHIYYGAKISQGKTRIPGGKPWSILIRTSTRILTDFEVCILLL